MNATVSISMRMTAGELHTLAATLSDFILHARGPMQGRLPGAYADIRELAPRCAESAEIRGQRGAGLRAGRVLVAVPCVVDAETHRRPAGERPFPRSAAPAAAVPVSEAQHRAKPHFVRACLPALAPAPGSRLYLLSRHRTGVRRRRMGTDASARSAVSGGVRSCSAWLRAIERCRASRASAVGGRGGTTRCTLLLLISETHSIVLQGYFDAEPAPQHRCGATQGRTPGGERAWCFANGRGRRAE